MLKVFAAAAPIQPPSSVPSTSQRCTSPRCACSIAGIAATKRSSMTLGFVNAKYALMVSNNSLLFVPPSGAGNHTFGRW